MKVYVLSILINVGTSDQEYDTISVCSSIDKCKKEALEELKLSSYNVNINDLKVGHIFETGTSDIFEFSVSEYNKYNRKYKFSIWETELI